MMNLLTNRCSANPLHQRFGLPPIAHCPAGAQKMPSSYTCSWPALPGQSPERCVATHRANVGAKEERRDQIDRAGRLTRGTVGGGT